MIALSDEEFAGLVGEALDEMIERFGRDMDNVAIVWDEEPSAEQRHKMQLRAYQTLFGLYEGIPLTKRGAGYNLVLPDKITVFKGPMTMAASDTSHLKQLIHNTLWHEIAHHFGLDHGRIEDLEKRRRGRPSGDFQPGTLD